MIKFSESLERKAGYPWPTDLSFDDDHTVTELAGARARWVTKVARRTVDEAVGSGAAVVVGGLFWLSDVRADGAPSPISRVEALAESSATRLKAFGGVVLDRISGSVEGIAEVFDPTVGHQQLAEHWAGPQTKQQSEQLLGGE